MKFSNLYREVAKSCVPLGSTLEEWHEAVGKDLHLVADSQVYDPIFVRVALSANAPPTEIALRPWVNGWYEAAQKGIAEMLGIRDPRNLELVDDFEDNIATWDVDRLASYRDAFRALYKDNVVHALNPPSRIADSLHPARDCLLDNWWEETSRKVANAIAAKLTGTAGVTQLSELCAFDGPVESEIRSVLTEAIDQRFIDSHALTDEAKAVSPDQLVKDLSGAILTALRMSIRENQELVSDCMASHIGDSIFSDGPKASVQDEMGQYLNIAGHALGYPAGNDLLIIITDGKNKKKKRKGRRRGQGVTVHNVTKTTRYDPFFYGHPYRDHPSWWYGTPMYPGHRHHHHYYRRGPSVVTQDTTVVQPHAYRGDNKQVVKLYHSFAGRPPAPTVAFLKKAGLTEEEAVLTLASPKDAKKGEVSFVEVVDKKQDAQEVKQEEVSVEKQEVPAVVKEEKKVGRRYTDEQDTAYMAGISNEVPALVSRTRKKKAATRTIPRKRETSERSSSSRAPRMTYDNAQHSGGLVRRAKVESRSANVGAKAERTGRPGTRLVRRTQNKESLRSSPAPKQRLSLIHI